MRRPWHRRLRHRNATTRAGRGGSCDAGRRAGRDFGAGRDVATGRYRGMFLAGTASILWFFMIFAGRFAALIGVSVSILVLCGLCAGMEPAEY